MTVDVTKWRAIGTAIPQADWTPVERQGVPGLSTAVESFLVVFYNLKNPNQADFLYRSKLVVRMVYPQNRYGLRGIETKPLWFRPSPDPTEFTLDFPRAMLESGTIFRSFECRRWNRFNRSNLNTDGAWEIEIYESLNPVDLGEPPPVPPPRGPGWEWQY